MKILMIVAIIVLVIANILPYAKMGVSDRPAKLIRLIAAAFIGAVSIAYLISTF